MQFPDRIVPAFGGASCLRLQRFLSGIGTQDCEVYRESIEERSIVDIMAFCGCLAATPSNYCSPCEESSVEIISSTRDVGSPISLNCSELTVAASHVADESFCQSLQIFSGECCEVVDEISNLPQTPCSLCGDDRIPLIDPDVAEVPGKRGFSCSEARDIADFFLADTETCRGFTAGLAPGCCKYDDRCSLCSDPTSTLLYPDRQLPFTMEGMKCIDVEFGLGYLDSSQCSSFRDAISGIDLASWCGCEDAVFANPWCSLCGDDLEVVQNIQIPDAPIGVTCQSLAEWAPYIKTNGFCETRITMLRGECCRATPPSRSPSDSPTMMPTSAPNAVSSTGIAQLVAYRVSVKRIILSLAGYSLLALVVG